LQEIRIADTKSPERNIFLSFIILLLLCIELLKHLILFQWSMD
jgi:hypothetical protein